MFRPRSINRVISLCNLKNYHSFCSKLAKMTISSKQSQLHVPAVETCKSSISTKFELRKAHCRHCYSTKSHKTSIPSTTSILQNPSQLSLCHNSSNHFHSISRPHSTSADSGLLHCNSISSSHRYVHTTASLQGLEEFFEDKKNLGEDKVGSGREWKVEELRLKDNVTLHKLWYVLLKEQNMLMTMEEEAERRDVLMPSPERIEKVRESMKNIKAVTKERDEALNELKTGQKELHPGRWEKTVFGYMRYVPAKEHFVPAYMNKRYATKRRKYGGYMIKYIRLWMEKELKLRKKHARSERRKEESLRKAFPDSDYWKE